MVPTVRKYLGISGSIREGASSTLVLQWIGRRITSRDEFHVFGELRKIPAFDGVEPAPKQVQLFIDDIRRSDAVIFCSPEYAHGVSGVLKNALDWTVSSDVWMNKRVAVITTAGQGDHAHASLIEILRTMSCNVKKESCLLIPFIKAKMNAAGDVTDHQTTEAIADIIQSLQKSPQE